MSASTPETRHEPEQQRYAAYVDGDLAGFAAYEADDERIVFTHTEVDPSFEGQGVGSALARGALDDVREQGGRSVVPQCSFIREWIAKHPDYQDLVA
ncbi:GNAT family N-acetyltransferase [Nocardioides sp. SYSU DS0663]|uniref:GNAT family N-acetyltransferase n=1 Tax=Nocardioides sp. SYSU DS0663 TaxID=3416445 RepID=UPI003F4B1F12